MISNLAFHYLCVLMMLSGASQSASRVGLGQSETLSVSRVRFSYVSPVDAAPDIGGRLDFDGFSYCFGPSGNPSKVIRVQTKAAAKTVSEAVEGYRHDEVYRRATNWLVAAKIDLNRLYSQRTVNIQQRSLEVKFPSGRTAHKTWLPVYDVVWGPNDDPAVKVSIDANTCQLLEMEVKDASYFMRSSFSFTNFLSTTNVTDAEFRAFNHDQRVAFATKYTKLPLSLCNRFDDSNELPKALLMGEEESGRKRVPAK